MQYRKMALLALFRLKQKICDLFSSKRRQGLERLPCINSNNSGSYENSGNYGSAINVG